MTHISVRSEARSLNTQIVPSCLQRAMSNALSILPWVDIAFNKPIFIATGLHCGEDPCWPPIFALLNIGPGHSKGIPMNFQTFDGYALATSVIC